MGRRIAIVGAGQSGLQLGLGLLGVGHSVTLVSNRTAAEVLTGPVQSSQCMFESALATERAMGLDAWAAECPPVDGIALTTADPDGSRAISCKQVSVEQALRDLYKAGTLLDKVVASLP